MFPHRDDRASHANVSPACTRRLCAGARPGYEKAAPRIARSANSALGRRGPSMLPGDASQYLRVLASACRPTSAIKVEFRYVRRRTYTRSTRAHHLALDVAQSQWRSAALLPASRWANGGAL